MMLEANKCDHPLCVSQLIGETLGAHHILKYFVLLQVQTNCPPLKGPKAMAESLGATERFDKL